MTGRPFLAAWLATWRALRRYHRFETRGLEHLLGPDPVMIAGYHGRPLAWDLCMLTVDLYDRRGWLPHGIAHTVFATGSIGRRLIDELGFVTGDSPELQTAIERGEHVLVAPGGTRECARSFRVRYRVDWGRHTGYLKLARRLGVPIVPVGASGVDDLYINLVDGHGLGKTLRVPARLPMWLAFGPTGLWPFTPAFPVKIKQVIGAPLDVGREGDGRDLQALHAQVQAAVQHCIDQARA